MLIAPPEMQILETNIMNSLIYLPKVIHVHLPDKGLPLTEFKVEGKKIFCKFLFLLDHHLCAIIAEIDILFVLLNYSINTFIILVSFTMKDCPFSWCIVES